MKNVLPISLRALLRKPVFTIINILGLTLAVLVTSLIFLYIEREWSTDQHLVDNERTYRVLRLGERNGDSYRIGVTSGPYASALLTDFPEDIELTSRVIFSENLISPKENAYFNEDRVLMADSTFFNMFNFTFTHGSSETAFDLPSSVVLTETKAETYFGDENPIGKVLTFDKHHQYIVSGVIEDPSENSHLNFDLVSRIDLIYGRSSFDEWWSNAFLTYIRLKAETDPEQLSQQLPQFIDKYLGDDFTESGNRIDVLIQPFSEIYFGDDVQYDFALHGDFQSVTIFLFIAIFILILACINFINLNTAMINERIQDLNIRRIMGSGYRRLLTMFAKEILALAMVSTFIGLLLLEIVIPSFNLFFSTQLSFDLFSIETLFLASGFSVSILVLSMLYPIIILKNAQTTLNLNSKSSTQKGMGWVRQSLIIFQFACSTVIIVATAIIWKQMDFVMDHSMGFEKRGVLVVRNNNDDIQINANRFIERVERIPEVEVVSGLSSLPGGFHDTMNFREKGKSETHRIRTTFSDPNYLDVLSIEMRAGRYFYEDNEADIERSIVINEKAANLLGYEPEEIIGKQIRNLYIDTLDRQIIGVVKDFNFTSLKSDVEPLAIAPTRYFNRFGIQFSGNSISAIVEKVKSEYREFVSGYDMDYYFLEDSISDIYKKEASQKKLLTLLALVSILIACLGILGLAIYITVSKMKEVVIRKVFGANLNHIVFILSKVFVKLIGISALISIPIAYLLMNQWLSTFSYRIDIDFPILFLPICAVMVIGLSTIFYTVLKASRVNISHEIRE